MSDYIATTREHYQELTRDAERFRKLERAIIRERTTVIEGVYAKNKDLRELAEIGRLAVEEARAWNAYMRSSDPTDGLAQAFSKVEGSAEKAANAYLAKQPKP